IVRVPPLPVAILLRVDQPALFEPFQGGGADPHLVGCLGNAHTHLLFRGFAVLPGPSPTIPDHVPPAATRRHRPGPSCSEAPGLGQVAASARGPGRGRGETPSGIAPSGSRPATPHEAPLRVPFCF